MYGYVHTSIEVLCALKKKGAYPFMAKSIKSRYFEFIIYPESLPDDFIDCLTETGVRFALSPLHDKDIISNRDIIRTPESCSGLKVGDYKKAHYHLLLWFHGPVTMENVFNRFEFLNSKVCMMIVDLRKRYEYFIHLNDPDKYQYDAHDIVLGNGFNIRDTDELTPAQILDIKKDIIAHINKYNLLTYSELTDFFLNSDSDIYTDYFRVISTNTIFFTSYLKSYSKSVLASERSHDPNYKEVE